MTCLSPDMPIFRSGRASNCCTGIAQVIDKMGENSAMEEQVSPRAVAVDSPSSKMLQFLRKHYGLTNPIFASNNYVIFPGFFEQQKLTSNVELSRLSSAEETPAAVLINSPRTISPKQTSPLERSNFTIPHTRVHAMPTKLTVIKPYKDAEELPVIHKPSDNVERPHVSSKGKTNIIVDPSKERNPNEFPKSEVSDT
ncbi:unnamed protein product [Echinostoma caproni]|uniref:N-acetyltransferase domain-containing protein n=1 Tax=Echinostoma caproni TaxID=27848 RepID=A0A183ABM3_9TREM|nr:unnamed protein product [Echinostoma caproni]